MTKSGHIGRVLLAIWMIVFIPVMAGYHHHAIGNPGPDRPIFADPSSGHHQGPGNPPCDICARLAVPAVVGSTINVTPLSISAQFTCPDNRFGQPAHLFSPIKDRAPPLFVA